MNTLILHHLFSINDVKLNCPAWRFGFKPSSGIPDEGLKPKRRAEQFNFTSFI